MCPNGADSVKCSVTCFVPLFPSATLTAGGAVRTGTGSSSTTWKFVIAYDMLESMSEMNPGMP